MNIFHDYKFTWWQLGIFKLSLLSIGIILGIYWGDFFNNSLVYVSIVAVISTLYIIAISLKQNK